MRRLVKETDGSDIQIADRVEFQGEVAHVSQISPDLPHSEAEGSGTGAVFVTLLRNGSVERIDNPAMIGCAWA